MTLGPTHVAFEALIVWFFMGKKNRTIFSGKLWLFTLITLFGLFPDLDTFFYIHRTYLHSIVWPFLIILGVLCWLFFKKVIKKEIVKEKANLIWRSIILASIFIVLHAILDLSSGPVLLFYPFDNRLYELNATMIWDLDAAFFLEGFKFNWTSYSIEEAFDLFILNLSPSERIEYFGTEFLELYINEFPIHFLSLLTWFTFFPLASLIIWIKKFPKPKVFFSHIKKFKNPLLVCGILLCSFGLILGPAFSLNRTERRQQTMLLQFNPQEAIFGQYQTFNLEKNDRINLQGVIAGNNSACDVVGVLANKTQFNEVNNSLVGIFNLYNNKTLGYNYSWLVITYRDIVQNFTANSLNYYLLSRNLTNGISYTFPEKMIIYSLILIQNWNESINFEVETKMVNTLQIKRVKEFSFGITFLIAGFSTFIVPFIDIITKIKKESKIDNTEMTTKEMKDSSFDT